MKDLFAQIAFWFENQITIGTPNVSILMYHSISPKDTCVDVTPTDFKKQLEYLSRKYHFISVDDAVDYIDEKKDYYSKPAVAFTFDDGYANLMRIVPVLKKYGIKPLVFITAAPTLVNREELNNPHKLLTEEQVRTLIACGWEIGCHTLTHPDLLTISATQMEQEIRDAKTMLENKYGVDVKYFAYPKGHYNDTIVRLVRDAGYHAAFTTNRGLITNRTNRYKIHRLGIDRTVTLRTFPFMLGYSALAYFGAKQTTQYLTNEGMRIIQFITRRKTVRARMS